MIILNETFLKGFFFIVSILCKRRSIKASRKDFNAYYCDLTFLQNLSFHLHLLQASQGSNHHISNCQQSLTPNQVDGDEDVWRGHSIAALRRRASELNSSIPSYLHNHNYDHHSSVYWKTSAPKTGSEWCALINCIQS